MEPSEQATARVSFDLPPSGPASVPAPRRGARARELFLVTGRAADDELLGGDHRRALDAWRVSVRPCTPETLDEIADRHPDLVLVDAHHGDESAFRLASRIHGALGSFAPPVIVLIAFGTEEDFERAYAFGAADVLAVPIAPALLRVKLDRYAKRRELPTEKLGPFRIQRMLGRGGHGTVFLAEIDGAAAGTPPVALKVVPLDAIRDEPETLARFHRESEALRMLRSDRIPRLVAAGRVADSFYCAMEFIAGENLHARLARGPLDDRGVARLIDELAGALAELHDLGLVHRDVKPSNVILTPQGTAKLVDFGLAKSSADPSVTRTDEVLGTPQYMSPEVARGEPATAATDAFALGVTALEAARGFCGADGSAYALLRRRAKGEVPPARELLADAPAPLRRIIEGLLHPVAAARLGAATARRLLRGATAAA